MNPADKATDGGNSFQWIGPPPPQIVGFRFHFSAASGGAAWALVHRLCDAAIVDVGLLCVGFAGISAALASATGADKRRLVLLVPLVTYRILVGVRGYRWAWRSGRFRDPEQFMAVQRLWLFLGAGLLVALTAAYAVWWTAGSPGLEWFVRLGGG